MRRWQTYGQRDTPVQAESDPAFIGIDMVRDRGILAPGMVPRAENKRCRDGKCSTRSGIVLPPDFNPQFFSAIIGSGIYSNPNGEEVMLVANSGADFVWLLQYGKDPVQIDLDAGQTMGSVAVEFVQAFDKVLLLRRPISGQPPLIWDGNVLNTFDPVALGPVGGGAELIPATWDGEPFQNRILLYNSQFTTLPWRDQLIVTDPLDYTQYDKQLATFRVNSGQADWIVRVWGLPRGGVVVYKRRSLTLFSNFASNFFLTEQRVLSQRLGLISKRALVEDGADTLFMSEPGGIYRLSEVIQEQIATEPVPVSEQIRPMIDRINWGPASIWACAEVLKDYAFFGAPIDGVGGGCNAIFVMNLATKQWESNRDWWDNVHFRLNRLLKTQYDGVQSLYGLDYANKRIYKLYEGVVDQIDSSDPVPIQDVMETRGYTLGDPTAFKRFQRAVVTIQTNSPEVVVTGITDGVNEERVLKTITKNRLKWYPHARDDFNLATDDPLAPKREDYSTAIDSNAAGEDFEGLPIGPIFTLPATTLPSDEPKQQSLEPMSVRTNGRWLSLRVENKLGSCDVLAAGVEGIPVMNTRVAA